MELINKIYVYENGRVEILFYFQDELNEAIELVEQYLGEPDDSICDIPESDDLLMTGGVTNGG